MLLKKNFKQICTRLFEVFKAMAHPPAGSEKIGRDRKRGIEKDRTFSISSK